MGVLSALLTGDQPVQLIGKPSPAIWMKLRQHFSGGQQQCGIDILGAPLAGHIKIAHRIQLIAPEFRTDGAGGSGRIDIQNTAAQGKLPHAFYQCAAAIAQRNQLSGELLQRITAADPQGQGGSPQNCGGDGAEAQGLRRGQKNGISLLSQLVQHGKPLMLPATGDRSTHKAQLTSGKNRGLFAEKSAELLRHTGGGQIVLTDHQNFAPCILMQCSSHMCPVNGTEAGNGAGKILLRILFQRLVFRQ